METLSSIKLSRRTLIATAVSAGLIGTKFATAGDSVSADEKEKGPMGLVSVYDFGAVKLHSYMAPSFSAVVTTQIIETASELHVIDAQFVQSIAKEVRAYANSLGKPIAGVYLSHWHPDHLLGASQFEGIPFMTTEDISADCNRNEMTYLKRKEQFNDDTVLSLPKGTLQVGNNNWDGVKVVVNQINDCEAEHTLTFHIPEVGLMIVQDLMFNNAHSFPLGNHTNWISTLETIRNTEGLRLLGCGHGLPATTGAITDSIAYLKFQKAVFGNEKDAESASTALKLAFPHYEGQDSLRFISALYK